MKKRNQIDNAARTNDENKEILNVSFKEFFIYYFFCVMIFFVFVKKAKRAIETKEVPFLSEPDQEVSV